MIFPNEAIVLAGGLGTRLKSVISEIPKPMAPIGDLPFLEYLLRYLQNQGVVRVVLAVGYRYEVIREYFGNRYRNIELVYAVEEEPLGTGGGILNALSKTQSDEVLLLNGDTFFEVNLKELFRVHHESKAVLSLSLKWMLEFDRYGSVSLDGNLITQFNEKRYLSEGWINGGVYVMNRSIFEGYSPGERFSFETGIMEKLVQSKPVAAYKCYDYFIDIGIPEDYSRAMLELPARPIFG